MKRLQELEIYFEKFSSFMAFIGSFLFIFIMIIVCLEVFMRYFINYPLTWVIETAEFSLLFITFLGISWVLSKEGHVSIEIFVAMLSKRNRYRLEFVTSTVGASICLILTIFGTQAVLNAYHIGRTTRTAMMLKQWPLLIIMPFGFLLLFFQFIINLHRLKRKMKKHIPNGDNQWNGG